MSRVKMVRESEGLSMAKFAERLGVSHGSISLLESGKRNLTPQMAKLISKEFGVNETWLLTGEGSMMDPISPEDEVAQLAADLYALEPDSYEFRMIKKIAKLAQTLTDEEFAALRKVIKTLADGE